MNVTTSAADEMTLPRSFAHSLTSFGHETAASVACERSENIRVLSAKNARHSQGGFGGCNPLNQSR